MQYLTQKELTKMMLLSYERIEKNKEKINKINVFPVPDQDTGGNLAKTLEGIKKAIENKEFEDLDSLSQGILDGALTAAQGNAGVIYTGFLAGFLPAFQNKNPMGAKKIAGAMEEGAKRARQSIQNPKEGTILDVIDATAITFQRESRGENDIVKILRKAIEKASEALLATREKMEIFRKANVVDAGGLGYLTILEGYLGALEEEKKGEKEVEEEPSEKIRRFVQVLSNRYEVVSLIKNPKFSEQEVREKLKRLGNCLDIVQIGDRMKIHIHTDYPDEVKKIMRDLGKVQSLREEDMAKEVAGEESVRKVSIGIITDEIADLTQKITEHYQIEVVPYKIDWPEGRDLPGENIYQKMREAEKRGITKLPKTSQASPKEFLDGYQKQLKRFKKVLCIPLSSKLSGGYNSACQAKEILPEEQKNKVYVLDSFQATGGQALLILKAIDLIQEQREISEVIAELKNTIPNIHLCGLLEDPKWLEWGGRASHSQATWMRRLQKIGVRPLIGIKDGKVEKIGFRFGIRDIPEAIFKEIEAKSRKKREEGKKIRVVITHCDNLKDAQKLKERLKEIRAEVSFVNLTGPVVGVHVGPGSVIAGWMAF
jgi:hypothetical protein